MRWLFVILVGLHALLLACLGFLPADAIPFQAWLPNDKLLHFGGFFIFALLVFFIWESSHLVHLLTWTSLSVGSLAVVSEMIQPILSPTRAFDGQDITANLLGTAMGILIALAAERVRRNRLLASSSPSTQQDDCQSRGRYEVIEMESNASSAAVAI